MPNNNPKQPMPPRLARECRRLRLTFREQETLALVIIGETRKAAAEKMGCSPRTVKFHSENIQRKLGAHSITHAVAIVLLSEKPSVPKVG